MIHLVKQSNTTVQAVELKRLACVNNPFIKGAILNADEFSKKLELYPQHCCKKCVGIFRKLKDTV